jgi:hypothetical protein
LVFKPTPKLVGEKILSSAKLRITQFVFFFLVENVGQLGEAPNYPTRSSKQPSNIRKGGINQQTNRKQKEEESQR